MELQIKTAMQMRDQGHALKQKALDLVAEAELKVGMRGLALERVALVCANIAHGQPQKITVSCFLPDKLGDVYTSRKTGSCVVAVQSASRQPDPIGFGI